MLKAKCRAGIFPFSNKKEKEAEDNNGKHISEYDLRLDLDL